MDFPGQPVQVEPVGRDTTRDDREDGRDRGGPDESPEEVRRRQGLSDYRDRFEYGSDTRILEERNSE